MKRVLTVIAAILFAIAAFAQNSQRWDADKAASWFEEKGWMSGCDYIPAYAINQLEMWQEDTFNPEEIDKELGWAEDLGFYLMRVFLHHLLWETDRDGLVARMNQYLDIASGHGISTMFVFLDDCWEVTAAPGKQPAPKKGVHNSGWLADPGALYFEQDGKSYAADTTTIVNTLEKYVKDIITEFKDDDRIAYWDLYNEPGGGPQHCYRYRSLPLLKDIFRWASEIRPSQPLTSGIWSCLLGDMNVWQINNSDIVSYHTYETLESHEHLLDTLATYGRPMVCTEYMARTQKSTFQAIMPMLRERNVAAINWGFVSGKTNTIFPWESPEGSEEPELWFHDVLRPDGTPYSEDEARTIKAVNGKTASINVTPYPQEVSTGEGYCNVKGARIRVARGLRSFSTRDFAAKFKAASAGRGEARIVFRRDRSLASDAYTLSISSDKVTVRASSKEGARYAVATLMQMLPVEIYSGKIAPSRWELPVCEIKDAPRYGHRGVLLDCSRHFFSVEEVKRFLDVMSVYKMNRFHWHLTDDHGWRFESKKYPLLTELGSVRPGSMNGWDAENLDMTPYGGFYTQDEMRDVVAYAKDRGIEIVPEIDLPAHLVSALKAYPELGCTGGPYECMIVWDIAKDVLCAGKESSFEFLGDIFTELCDIFPYEYVHIGGDECPKLRWENCPACQAKIAELGLKDTEHGTAEQYLQNYVTARVQKMLADKGRKVIGWDEILEGELAPGATIMSWRGTEGGIKASNAGFDVIMTPVEYCYLDMRYADSPDEPVGPARVLPLEKCYSFNPVEGLDEAAASHVLGLQGNVWGEFIATPEHAEYMLLPRMLALSEVAWGTADDYTRFHNNVISHEERVLRQLGMNHRTEW